MNVGHLTEEELRQYQTRSMSPAGLLAADDHLAECGDCRKSLSLMGKDSAEGSALLRCLTGEGPLAMRHLSHDELVAYAEEAWSNADQQWVLGHLEACTDCREDAEDLKSFRAELAKPGPSALKTAPERSRSFWTIPLWAGAAAAVLLAIFLGVRSRQDNGQPGPAVLVQLNDEGGRIGLDSSGRLVTPTPLNEQDSTQVKDALLHKRLEAAAALSPLQSRQGTLLGESGAPSSLRIIAPIGTVVVSAKPQFRWQGVDKASAYIVSVYDSRFQKVAESPRLVQHEWNADHALSRGVIYTWQVTALVKGKAIRAPAPPAPEARFQVLSQAEAEQIERAQREHPNSHLLLGVLYANAGVMEDSERELNALLAANPDSAVAKGLLGSVEQLRSKR